MNFSLFEKNLFKNTTFRLSLLYLLIITTVVLIFNIVIIGSSNVNNAEIVAQPNSSGIITLNDEIKRMIIEARNERAGQQLAVSLLWLDAIILTLGGIGSYWLAKKTLEPLEKAHNLQSQFVSDVSHEIRTPLATMQLETEISLKDKLATKTDLKETLESNLEEIKSLDSLTQMLLRLSRIDKEVELKTINLNEIVESRLKKFPKENIDFSATKTFLTTANETAVDELISILIDNALKYRTDNSPIEVKIFREHRQAILEVSNTSEEISKENLDKLFERFYREDRARSRNSETCGHGLGLSIAKKLVELMNASLSVRNEKYQDGKDYKYKTIFRVGFNFSK